MWLFSTAQAIVIQYRNFQNQSKSFTVDAGSVTRKNNHILARVVSSGQWIALARNRIQNMPEVDLALSERDRTGAPRPNSRERQVLAITKNITPLRRYTKKSRPSTPTGELYKAWNARKRRLAHPKRQERANAPAGRFPLVAGRSAH